MTTARRYVRGLGVIEVGSPKPTKKKRKTSKKPKAKSAARKRARKPAAKKLTRRPAREKEASLRKAKRAYAAADKAISAHRRAYDAEIRRRAELNRKAMLTGRPYYKPTAAEEERLRALWIDSAGSFRARQSQLEKQFHRAHAEYNRWLHGYARTRED
jgi:hypothetical protein